MKGVMEHFGMKRLIVISLSGLAMAANAQVQALVLTNGESYVFSFDSQSLPPPQVRPYSGNSSGIFGVDAYGSCDWIIEAFENTVTGPPLVSYESEMVEDCSSARLLPGAWQDLQGMLRFTSIGETRVGPIEIEINVP